MPSAPDDDDDDARGRPARGVRSYAEYSGLALQMIAPILAGVYGGRWLDAYLGGGRAWTIVGSLLGIALALYLPLRGLLRGGDWPD